jgi:hypothetical protein
MGSQLIITGFDPNGPFGGLILPPSMRKRQRETRFVQEWKLTMQQYVALMNPFKGPRRQRGNFAMFPAGTTAGKHVVPAGNVVLNAHTGAGQFEDTTPSGTAGCAASFETDGTLWERNDIEIDVEQSGEWWDNEPVTGVGDFYEVRALSTGKTGTWSSQAASDDTWITITSTRQWKVTKGSPNGSKTTTATFEVGPDGVESADDSAAITCRAEYNDN